MRSLYLIRASVSEQVRDRKFIFILLISVFLGFLCMPSIHAGYSIFYLGGVRGVYNSAWVGALGVMLPVILLWLPGFYLLRSRVSEDKRLKIGQLLSATSTSKWQYIFTKVMANFLILSFLNILFIITLVILQLIQHEVLSIELTKYVIPFVVVSVPYLLVLASLTVLFDVIDFLKSTLGNVMIFVCWVVLSVLSINSPGEIMDLFGLGYIFNSMANGARMNYPELKFDGGSFGYYPVTNETPTFMWEGMTFDSTFLGSRLVWVMISLGIIVLATICFDRFCTIKTSKAPKQLAHVKEPVESGIDNFTYKHSYKRTKTPNLLAVLMAEYKLILTNVSIKWKATFLIGMAIPYIAPFTPNDNWLGLVLIAALPALSQSGTHEKEYGTRDLVASSMGYKYRWCMIWITNFSLGLLLCSGILIKFIISGEYLYVVNWIVGIGFIVTVALILGTLTERRKYFEGIFVVLLYLGPINGIEIFDFLGIYRINLMLYSVITASLFALGWVYTKLQDNHKLMRRSF